MEDEAEGEYEKITEFIESKEILGGKSILNILGNANKIKFKGGAHKLRISSYIDTLYFFGGKRTINVKSSINNLIIEGGTSKIFVHNFGDCQINNIDISEGIHEIIIYSFVNELKIIGGTTKIMCNYEISRINKIKILRGVSDIFK